MVSQRVIQQMDGLATLRALLEIKPKDVIATHEEARKQLALTQEQEEKYKSALATIAKAAEIEAAQKLQVDAIVAARDAHATKANALVKDKDDFAKYKESTNAEIDKRFKELNDATKMHEEDKKKTVTQNAVAESALKQRELAAQRKEEENKRFAEGLALENEKISKQRAAIAKKAQLVAQAEAIEG